MRTLVLSFVFALLALSIILVWKPFYAFTVISSTGLSGAKPAGQIIKGFSLTQTVDPRRLVKNGAGDGQPNCLAVRFATYMRKNSGSILVNWQQGDATRTWRIAASELRDNTYRDLCLGAGIDVRKPFSVEINGIDGVKGRSATVWLSAASNERARINGTLAERGLAIRLSQRKYIGPSEIIKVGHGAFVLSWLCTLCIGIAALLAVQLRRARHDAPRHYVI